VIAAFADGTSTTMSVSRLTFGRSASGAWSCRPLSGSTTVRIAPATPSAAQPQVDLVRRFDGGVASDDPATCTPAAATPEACAAAARQAVAAFGITGCVL
jgi:hypothetical protein